MEASASAPQKATSSSAAPSTNSVVPRYEVPMDEEDPRFVKSFAIHQEKEIKEFFEEFGFVVVRDVLTQAECEATVGEIWSYVETGKWRSRAADVDRHDPRTWVNNNWPGMRDEGIVGSAVVFKPQALRNRQNPNVHKVCSIILGREDLMVNHDRYGFFRPTKNIPFPSETDPTQVTPRDRPDWQTNRNVHLDMNPWNFVSAESSKEGDDLLASLRYNHTGEFIDENNEVGVLVDNRLHIQALLNLIDNVAEDGGFHVVPGFARHIVEWAHATRNTVARRFVPQQTFIVLPVSEPVQKLACHVTCRAGSLVVWNQRTAHGSRPNSSSKARMAQFIKLFPAIDLTTERGQARKAAVEAELANAGFTDEVTELGAKLFGLKSWN